MKPPVLVLTLAALLSGCAAYQPSALAGGPDIHADRAALKTDLAALRLEPLKPIAVDLADGVTPREAAVLAVLNNAGLTAKRAAQGVTQAQAFSAGLLPGPQIALSIDHPSSGPDTLTAFSLAPSLDLASLMARSATKQASAATVKQGDLDLLWAEWGVAQQAREQAETVLAAQAREARLRTLLDAATERSARSAHALAAGDVTLQTSTADLAAKLEAGAALAAAEGDEAKARATLNGLLNLDLAVGLPLAADPDTGYAAAAIRQALAALPARRPDLLALRAGFEAQDANVRIAVLNQFPLTQIGLAFARDPGGTVTEGLSAAFALPIFNGAKGALAVQTATRDQLAAEYQARLDETVAEVKAAQGDLARAQARAAGLAADLPAAEAALAPAKDAFGRGDLDSQTYLTLMQTVVTKRADLDDARLQARLAEIQVETLLFLPPLAAAPRPKP